MDIHTASKYMVHGYRIRRPHWDERCYLYKEYNDVVSQIVRVLHPDPTPDTYKKSSWTPRLHDMLADDWEIITEGIISHFPLQYEEKQ